MTGCLKERETHPQEKDHRTHEGDWHMEVNKAITQVAVRAAKRLTQRLI
jgi:hypothetical protein